MKATKIICWDVSTPDNLNMLGFKREFQAIDKANKRKKKALRQMNKALKREKESKDFYRDLWEMTSRKNADATRYIKELEQAVRDLERELDRIESVLTDDETD